MYNMYVRRRIWAQVTHRVLKSQKVLIYLRYLDTTCPLDFWNLSTLSVS